MVTSCHGWPTSPRIVSPFDERWGGWYVTGRRNRCIARASADSLRGKIDSATYPSVFSDVAALLVFDHQTTMSNMLTQSAGKFALHSIRKKRPDWARTLPRSCSQMT